MSTTPEREPEFRGLAFGVWSGDQSIRTVHTVHDWSPDWRHIEVRFLGHQRLTEGRLTLVRHVGATLRLWRPTAGYGAVFMTTATVVDSPTWPRRKPTVRLADVPALPGETLEHGVEHLIARLA